MNKLFFPKRISEPKSMSAEEFKVFNKLSEENYKRWNLPLVDHAIEESGIKNEGLILDVACGPGTLVKEFAKRSKNFNIYGIDISSYAINLAIKNCRGFDNITIRKSSVYKLPFPSNHFNLVICKDSLHHFDNPQKAIKEMLRVLKKEGTLYIQDMKRDVPFYLLKRTIPPKTILQKLQFYSVRASYTKKEIEKILSDLNIEDYKIWTRKIDYKIEQKYNKEGIDMKKLREGFQSRYVVIINNK